MICNKFERLASGQESLVMSRLHITSSGNEATIVTLRIYVSNKVGTIEEFLQIILRIHKMNVQNLYEQTQ